MARFKYWTVKETKYLLQLMRKEARRQEGLQPEAKVRYFKHKMDKKGYSRTIVEIKIKLIRLLSKYNYFVLSSLLVKKK